MCVVLGGVKVPGGYSSNITRCVNSDKIRGLKSHDNDALMQHLLPIEARNVGLPMQMADVIIELCYFFDDCAPKLIRRNILRSCTLT